MSDAGSGTALYPARGPKLILHEKTFQEAFRDWIRSAPWFLVSLLIHLAIGLVLANIDWRTLKEDDLRIIVASAIPEEIVPLLDDTEEQDDREIEKIDPPLESPDVNPVEVATPIVNDILDVNEPVIDARDAVSLIGTGGGRTGGKSSGKLKKRREGRGGGSATQRAVEWGLEWLSRHQDPEGFWDCDGYHYRCSSNRCEGGGRALNDAGVTGLALLAFLGAGSTPREGPYRTSVRNGIRYLCDIQDHESGCFATEEGEHFMYNHAIATLAMTEAYGLSGWPVLRKPALRAIEYIHRTRNPGEAWRYNLGAAGPEVRNDVSVTGWMIMCLASAEDFDIPVDRRALEEALAYIDAMTDSATGRSGYMERGSFSARDPGDERLWPYEKSEAMTAVGMLSRIFCTAILGNARDQDRMLRKGAALLEARTPRWSEEEGTIDYYYWYYGTYAMFQMDHPHWKTWKEPMMEAIIEHQETEGCGRGSWDPRLDPWGDHGGRVYATALCTLCLEVFYRYDRILGAREE